MEQLDRIVRTPGVLDGKARIRGRRISVSTIVGQVAAGYSSDQIIAEYPYLEREDILQALRYAAFLAQGREVEVNAA